ncbi:hypothetical protein DPX16_21799 [Anabarilius grahami]|uniref:Uncharacterized protein n=1 Tax=Anabarilius grahami TaxID=495550 RepID=A0A3N0Z4Y8_ANAGA|nr:hypothetical protein DPX16_21799 [Anabarilius grahami]
METDQEVSRSIRWEIKTHSIGWVSLISGRENFLFIFFFFFSSSLFLLSFPSSENLAPAEAEGTLLLQQRTNLAIELGSYGSGGDIVAAAAVEGSARQTELLRERGDNVAAP